MSFQDFLRDVRKEREFWNTVPASSVLVLFAVAFCLFAAIGAISQLQTSRASLAALWKAALISGSFAVFYAWLSVRKTWLWILPIIPVQVLCTWLVVWRFHSSNDTTLPAEIARWVSASATLAIVLVVVGYNLTLAFIGREAKRFLRLHAEVQLAGEIHKSLVPGIQQRIEDYEFYATSLASGMVGGDLVDIIACDGRWLAYVADVSGHGVPAGVLMAMIKSSVRTATRLHSDAKGLLEEVNEVLCSLKAPNMFATLGFVTYSSDGTLHYSLAGHLPILRRRNQRIELLHGQNLPLGISSEATFEITSLAIQKDEVLAIITDGLTEVFNKKGEELGLGKISETLRVSSDSTLPEIAKAIFDCADNHGPRSDDQSLFLIRKVK
jgi:hypothetical protein